jgi:hypothetical protein
MCISKINWWVQNYDQQRISLNTPLLWPAGHGPVSRYSIEVTQPNLKITWLFTRRQCFHWHSRFNSANNSICACYPHQPFTKTGSLRWRMFCGEWKTRKRPSFYRKIPDKHQTRLWGHLFHSPVADNPVHTNDPATVNILWLIGRTNNTQRRSMYSRDSHRNIWKEILYRNPDITPDLEINWFTFVFTSCNFNVRFY